METTILKRTHYCGELRPEHIGKEITVCGWVARRRDMGGLIFIDLRDRVGILQLAFDDNTAGEVFEAAATLRGEYVAGARGILRERSAKNMDIPTGEVELAVTELRVFAKSETPPFEIAENSQANETLRLKYRYLDLRRPDLQKNIIMRHKIAKVTRDYFYENGFIEIETPILIKSTPEGARDYLVPSRLQRGSFYALPQSPQIYKQLTMVAGFDRYIQLARCFRDEDLRADRQPEFTQIDIEMSFVDVEDILQMTEGYIGRLMREVMDIAIDPIPRMTYREAIERYGTDKPDTRYGMEIFDVGDIVAASGFGVFESAVSAGGGVRGITVKSLLSRKEIDKLTDFVKGVGGKGLAWVRLTPEGTASSFGKFVSEGTMAEIIERAAAETGDTVLLIADGNGGKALSQLGSLRVELAKRLELVPAGQFNYLWITEMPFFEYDEETGAYIAMHHPFTSPMDESLDYLETDKAAVRAKAYDLVLNGVELASGSIRITDPVLQRRMFDLLGLSEEETEKKFGFLVEAFKYGAPPHGGIATGLDRIAMQLLGCENLRDVTAFPKLQNASEPMTNCPDVVDKQQLDELGIGIIE